MEEDSIRHLCLTMLIDTGASIDIIKWNTRGYMDEVRPLF